MKTELPHARKPSQVGNAFRDLWEGFWRWKLWTAFAWEDIQRTYHRTIFGALWISISFAAFVGVKLFVFGALLKGISPHYYGAYLLLGYLGWSFISHSITAAPNVFIRNESWIKNDPLPFSVYVYQAVSQDLFSLLMMAVAVASLYWLTQQTLDAKALMVIPAVLVFLINSVWVKLFLGVVCTRHRDITQLVSTVMRMMLFMTPIMWTPEQIGANAMKILWWNPFFHFISILRAPVLDHQFATVSWVFVGCVTVIGWILALVAFISFRRRIPYWL